MKYTQYSRKRRSNSAFYIIIALCLVLIGGATWFAVSRIDDNTVLPDTSSIKSDLEDKTDEYTDDTPSYNENTQSDNMPTIPPDNEGNDTPDQSQPIDRTASNKAEKVKAYTMPVNGEILKDFSTDTLQYSATYNDMRIHAAVDIASAEGTLVSAMTDGKIQNIEDTAEYGKVVTIDHGDGLVIKYAGLKNVTAEKDTSVKMGTSIGAVGTVPCECSDQSHLHIEAFESGKAVSILKFFS